MIIKPELPIPNRVYVRQDGELYNVEFISTHLNTGETLINCKSINTGLYHTMTVEYWCEIMVNDNITGELKNVTVPEGYMLVSIGSTVTPRFELLSNIYKPLYERL
jgi:hypothetical protein